MTKRYQVFVSSTYEDLREERREVVQTLLSFDCIPTDMELFPAADDDSWTHIKRFIAECDYYVVIVGGRYGSTAPNGMSFTEMEYDYAVETGLPILAFLHGDPGTIPSSKAEPSDKGKSGLAAFRKKIESSRHASYWSSSGDLAGKVALGMASLMKTKPRVGWVRADAVPDSLKDELLRLRSEIDALNGQLTIARSRSAPDGVDDLAQGAETTNITIDIDAGGERLYVNVPVRWDSLMRAVLSQTFGGGAPPENVAATVASLVRREHATGLSGGEDPGWQQVHVGRADWGKILNQMIALGLVEARSDPTNPLATRYYATPYGVQTGARLLAIKRKQGA